MPKISSPVLVIHGTEDEVIDFSHGLAIYEKCPRAVDPLWVEVREFIGNFWNYPKEALSFMKMLVRFSILVKYF